MIGRPLFSGFALGRTHLAIPVALVLVLGCIVPLGVLVVFSVFEVDFDAFVLMPALSPRAWSDLFHTWSFWVLIGKAVISGAAAALTTSILGYPIALALASAPLNWKGIGTVVLLTPLYTGEIVRIYAWRIVLGSEGLINTLLLDLHIVASPVKWLLFTPFTTALVLTYNNLPYMVLAIWVSAEMVDKRLIEAARDLGARPLDAFFKVTLPLTTPGLAAGVFAVFALAAGEMLTPSLLGGTSGQTAMAMIDNLFGTAFDWPLASALALALLAALFLTAVALGFCLTRFKGARAVIGRGRA
ncbi:MAG: ABC transporter permease [Ancalomicrobiaceae bacterium]|nr:ABC transporter permease [Ancalomicrobiaceae bacterium]